MDFVAPRGAARVDTVVADEVGLWSSEVRPQAPGDCGTARAERFGRRGWRRVSVMPSVPALSAMQLTLAGTAGVAARPAPWVARALPGALAVAGRALLGIRPDSGVPLPQRDRIARPGWRGSPRIMGLRRGLPDDC